MNEMQETGIFLIIMIILLSFLVWSACLDDGEHKTLPYGYTRINKENETRIQIVDLSLSVTITYGYYEGKIAEKRSSL